MITTALMLSFALSPTQQVQRTKEQPVPCWFAKIVTEKDFAAVYDPATNRQDAALADGFAIKTKPRPSPPGPSLYYLNHGMQGSNEPMPDMWIFKLITMPCDPKWEGMVARIEFFTEESAPLPSETMYERFEKLTAVPSQPLHLSLGVKPLHRDKFLFRITLAHNGKSATSPIRDMRPGRDGW